MRKFKSERERKEFLGDLVGKELTDAEGGDSDELQTNRETAMAYYKGNLPGPAVDENGDVIPGRSRVVSLDVANMVNATLAMMREMLILDARLEIDPEGDEDEAQARAESDVCTDVLMKDNPGELVLLAAIKDGLLLKNGCVKVRTESGQCLVEAVPIENVSYTAGWAGTLRDIPFFAERISYTRSDLVEMGIARKVVEDLQTSGDAEVGTARARNIGADRNRDAESWDQEEVDCHEAYVLVDMNGDGVSERYRVLVADRDTCVEYEPVPGIPYAMGSPFIAPHRLTGESMFDRVAQLQDSNTTMLRQWHDNVAVVNNGRYAYDPGQVDEEDIMTPMAGGGIRARNPAASVVPLMVPDISSGIMLALDFNRRQRTESGGAALDMSSAEAQLANKAATVASIEKGNQELLSSMIASNFALTLISRLYELIHFHLREYSDRTYLARVRGQAVEIDPATWPTGRRMTIRCGLSPSQKAMRQQALSMHMQLQAQAMMQGMDGILASASTLYRTSQEWLRANGVEDAERLGIDPESQGAMQAAQARAEEAQAMQAQAAQMQQLQERMAQLQLQLEQAKIAEDARQADQELRHKYYATDMEAEIAEAKIAGQGTIDLEKQRMSNEQAERSAARAAEAGAAGGGGRAA